MRFHCRCNGNLRQGSLLTLQVLFKVVLLTQLVMLSEAKHLPRGVGGRLFATAQSDNEKALLPLMLQSYERPRQASRILVQGKVCFFDNKAEFG